MVEKQFAAPLVARTRDAVILLGVSRSMLFILEKQDPDFPKRFQLGKKASGFLMEELRAWVARRAAAGEKGEKKEGSQK